MTDSRPLRTVTVVGLGAMGGSVAKTVLRRAPHTPVFGVEPDRECAALARRDGVRVADRLEDCDVDDGVVVFAAPLDETVALVRQTAAAWGRAALATDVASLKVAVLGAAAAGSRAHPARRPAPVFVGAHPMCGTERSGYAAARDDLFDGARVWLCPLPDRGSATALAIARDFWTLLGGRPRSVAAPRHDRIMANASHLPQLVSNALAAVMDDAGLAPDLLGPGGRDMTRLAGSSPTMWLPLLKALADEDAAALLAMERKLASVREMLSQRDLGKLGALMKQGEQWVSARG